MKERNKSYKFHKTFVVGVGGRVSTLCMGVAWVRSMYVRFTITRLFVYLLSKIIKMIYYNEIFILAKERERKKKSQIRDHYFNEIIINLHLCTFDVCAMMMIKLRRANVFTFHNCRKLRQLFSSCPFFLILALIAFHFIEFHFHLWTFE